MDRCNWSTRFAISPTLSVAAAIADSKVTGSKIAWVLYLTRGPTARPSAKNTESSFPRSAILPNSWKCLTSRRLAAFVRGWRHAAS